MVDRLVKRAGACAVLGLLGIGLLGAAERGEAQGVGVQAAVPDAAERARLTEEIRQNYPAMPERLAAELVDSRGVVPDSSSCELVDWLVANPNPSDTRRRLLPTICRLPIDDLTADAVRDKLGDNAFSAVIEGDVLSILARSSEPTVRVCCGIQGDLQRLGESEYWAVRQRLPDAERAVLSLGVNLRSSTGFRPLIVRGPLAPPALPSAFPSAGRVIERQLASGALGETRRLSIYLPPGWSQDRRWPVVYLTDGAAISMAAIVEPMIVDGTIPPLVLVSALPAPVGIVGTDPAPGVDLRSAEYIHGRDRFDRHMTFFVEELVRYAQAEFAVSDKRDEVAVAGFSNGGVFALWAGLLHPEIFGDAIAMSPGVVQVGPDDLTRTPRARFQVSGGLYEAGFIRGARLAETALKDAGFEVTARFPAAGHDQEQWSYVFHEALKQIHARN